MGHDRPVDLGLLGCHRLSYLSAIGRLGKFEMRSFIFACVAAVVIACVGALALSYVQEPASVAFTKKSARI